MTRGSTIICGKDELTRAPAPDAEHIRRDFNSASAQPGSNTSPGLCGKLRSQGLAAETMTLPYSFLPSLTETVTAFGAVFALFVLLFVRL